MKWQIATGSRFLNVRGAFQNQCHILIEYIVFIIVAFKKKEKSRQGLKNYLVLFCFFFHLRSIIKFKIY